MYRHYNLYRQYSGLSYEGAKEPDTGDLQLSAVLHEYGEFPACLGENSFYLVSGRILRLDCHPSHEHQSGCHPPSSRAGGHAGTGVLCAEFPPVFHHPGGIFSGRIPGGPGF